jgi:two-component system, cell cycle sensor histidine kinase and response regulator CckA
VNQSGDTTVSTRGNAGAVRDESTAREAIRRSQRIASQLHQLIASSLTVAGLRNEHDIVESLARSTRRVFDADDAALSLETGFAAPLQGVATRGKMVLSSLPGELSDEVPSVRDGTSAPWIDGEWLVAPVLEGRGPARGVLAVRRAGGEFRAEDREVLTLLAQMAAAALGATELGREIESSEERLRILVDAAPAGIIELQLDGTVRWWNRAAAKIFGWSIYNEASDERAAIPDGAFAELAPLWAEVAASGSTGVRDLIEVEIRGRRRDLTVSAARLSDSDVVANIMMLVDDVTDHRQLKAEVHHAQQMEARGRVASSIAHDFNNLLTLISGYAEILLQELDPQDRSREMVKDIQITASRASMLTAQLQTIGRAPSLEPIVLDPVASLQLNAEVFERVLGSEIETIWSLSSDVGNIFVDAGQFEQMMLNLAINARDAMPDGGALRIGVDGVSLDEAAAREANVDPGDYVSITISDSGIGMSEETLAHCFDTFFTTKGPLKGTGLGLAAARRLVEGSNGSIICTSELGRGTTFRILLPASVAELTENPPMLVNERPRGTASVLVVDDDDDLRRMMVQVLSRNGYSVVAADSGEVALKRVEEMDDDFDLLLSDVVMGQLSGPQLAGLLQVARPTLRVLLTSGTADESIISGLMPGTAAFLAKPFRPSALIDKVHDLLSRR